MNQENNSIILFDGVCNFCNYWVNFIIDRDKKNQFKFTALQSEKGIELLKKLNLPANDFDSFILIRNDKTYKKSSAVFEIAKDISGWLKIILLFKYLPESFTDWIYSLIANNRYRIFGKKDVCRIPSEEEKAKFL
ncbi:MAG: thiol-disulfide oxidoreductase DCC family protein [Ignavibacterium sp.]|jgi:predicted DCC family thiol-disulfide oxidoreductase YuxK|nr:thiol-disulfide oxidoreductase DCC family protein [Ignavibacterium sp.]